MVMLSPKSLAEQKKKQEHQVASWYKQHKETEEELLKKYSNKSISLENLTLFTQQISAMLKSGLPLVSALDALLEGIEKISFKTILTSVRDQIVKGIPLSEATKKYPHAFPSMFTSMIEAGEASGTLAEGMENLAIYFSKTLKLVKKIKSAFTYPAVIISLAILLVAGIMIFIIPVFAEMFASFKAQLPLPTRMLIQISHFIGSNFVWIILFIIALVWSLKKFLRTNMGTRIKDKIVTKLPIFSELSLKSNIARFCRTYSVLLSSGVPILKTIEICSKTTENTYMINSCKQIMEGIKEGKQLSDILITIQYFPHLVYQMVKAGEKAGNVEKMVLNAADLYDNDVDNIISSLTSLLEPILICFLGVVIGSIVVSIFLPIFDLANVIK